MTKLKRDQNLFRLKELEECPVLEFSLDAERARIDLVVFTEPNILSKTFEEYAAHANSELCDREFARFRFFDIGDFQKKNGAKQFINQTQFHANGSGVDNIYGIFVSGAGNKYKLSACLSRFGSIEFSFHRIQFESRLARILNEGNDFRHYDVMTNEPIDFSNPFLGSKD
ncbi:hypothetical protein [uncultured Roseibium sp.]|uniref:hypothetical protein n=1 Tax=uncultured Roseibium sp. TaxID=1936171 RepID=UPI002639ECA6|nr:hypothetical protein [uncultured Roseibium sp.]